MEDIGLHVLESAAEEEERDIGEDVVCRTSEQWRIQLYALLEKRLIVMSRDLKGFFFQVVFPVLQVVLILAILTIQYNPAGKKVI